MPDLNDFNAYIVFKFHFGFTGRGAVCKPAFGAAFIVLQGVPHGICDFRFIRRFQGCFGMPGLAAFPPAQAAAGVWDNLLFICRRLRCGRAGIAAVSVKESLRMGKTVLQFPDNGIFFCQLPFIIRDNGGNPVICFFQGLPVFIAQFPYLVFLPVQFCLVFFPV